MMYNTQQHNNNITYNNKYRYIIYIIIVLSMLVVSFTIGYVIGDMVSMDTSNSIKVEDSAADLLNRIPK